MESLFLSAREVAKVLRVHHFTVLLWIKTGKLPAVRVGKRGRWRIHREQLEKLLEAR